MSKTIVFLLALTAALAVSISLRFRQPWGPPDRDSAASHRSRLILQPGQSGFDLRQATIPRNEIHSGGPPKDGIPALSNPPSVKASEADFLDATDRVIGVKIGAETRAYPIRILNFHELVNDRIGDVLFLVAYCPLCDSAAVFDRRTPLGKREFGVSGLLYNSNVLMYDRGGQPESLWSQILGEGVSGPAAGRKLKTLPMELTSWQEWKAQHPETRVLSAQTGHRRDYRRNPYEGYFHTPNLMFPVRPLDPRLPVKAPILAVWTDGGKSNAHPSQTGNGDAAFTRDYSLGGRAYSVRFDPRTNTARVADADDGVHWMHSFWFAWSAFHPETKIVTE